MLPLRPRRSLRPLRRPLTRRAALWYLAALALTGLTVATVRGALADAAAAEAAYGETVAVVVATAAVAPGDPVDSSVAELRELPRALVPPGALEDEPTGRAALVALWPGEVVLARRVAGGAAEGPSALLGAGERAVPVPLAVPGLPLARGDRIDVVAGGAVGGSPEGDLPVGATGPEVVASDAEVLEVGDEVVVVAVAADVAAELAAAVTAGPVVAALRPPGG